MVAVITLEAPFGDTNNFMIMGYICSGQRPKIPPDVPTNLAKLMERCWDTDPSVRPEFTDIRNEIDAWNADDSDVTYLIE